jgi:hypothetical protein
MQVKLSRRNLLSLLHKLELPGSHRTIIKQVDAHGPKCAGLSEIAVVAVSDEECYAGRDPGPMLPATEVFVAELTEALALVRQGSLPENLDEVKRG